MSNYDMLEAILSKIKDHAAEFKKEVIKDYWICLVSREVSITGRKEVLSGKAKFGILGDGKELPQVAMARAFRKGDFRSGYYRDQTFMMALDICSVQDYFAQLYADTIHDPFSGGRQMNAHFATPLINSSGEWLDHTTTFNVSADISPTSGQMARSLGLALASKLYRQSRDLNDLSVLFSNQGNEVSFVTIGDASTSEGVFWETMNAAAVQQVPLAVFVWDDGYGISVPIELQTVKQNISTALSGFSYEEGNNGIQIYTIKAWDYPNLVNTIQRGIDLTREKHIPVLFHIQEVTQPQGHSTSGSHERYKSRERLEWEGTQDCIVVFEEWMLTNKICSQEILDEIKILAKNFVKEERSKAWEKFNNNHKHNFDNLYEIINGLPSEIRELPKAKEILAAKNLTVHELTALARQLKIEIKTNNYDPDISLLNQWVKSVYHQAYEDYHSQLIGDDDQHFSRIDPVEPDFENAVELNGYQIINKYFDQLFENNKSVVAFGEDVGKIGDVNQGFAGLQDKFGALRVFDTGIREWTIIGQAIGLSMRGIRPIAEMQYLDYVVYALSALTDDLATVRYRSDGIQKAPAIVRTRGHRLEGIWHSGSPIGMLINSLRGIHICVPRNFTIAAGMYNTLLAGGDPGLIIECLNGYRLKEKCPNNLTDFKIPLGTIEILQKGNDVSLVTYGSCIRIAQSAIEILNKLQISVELIDIQTLLPFDIHQSITESIRKTNKLVILDEDVPGGASAFILQKILLDERAFEYLDASPICITASEHRPPYGSDGDYFSKPNVEDIVESIYQLMVEYHPSKYSKLN